MFGAIFALAMIVQAPAESAPDAIGDILANPPVEAAPPAATPPGPSARPLAPPPEVSQRYEFQMRSNFEARQARQGPLDGRWTLAGADGTPLYVFQLADPGPGRGPVEGAWRDVTRPGAGASGFLDSADRSGQDLTLRFDEKALTQALVVTLTLGVDGRWTGQIKLADQVRPVTMSRS